MQILILTGCATQQRANQLGDRMFKDFQNKNGSI